MSAARVRGPTSASASSATSTSKNITAAGRSGGRPLIAYSLRTPSSDSGSVASPYTVSDGNSATPPTEMQRLNVSTSSGVTLLCRS